jgi:NADH dehydrogenase
VTLLRRFSFLPVLPVSGDGAARFEPIWAQDAARCVVAALERGDGARYELAGPEVLSYDEMSDLVSQVAGRPRRLVHLPLPLVRAGLIGIRSLFGEAVFATWEEAELMEVPMLSERGTGDAEGLGVDPRRMAEVLSEP